MKIWHKLKKVLRALRRVVYVNKGPNPFPYYVERPIREEFGTMLQLEAGMQDHSTNESITEEILTRLINFWHAMKERTEAYKIPAVYRIGGLWGPIIASEALQPLSKGLDEGDRNSLNFLLKNFFRRLGNFLGEPTDFTSAAVKHRRWKTFRSFSSRWLDLYGEESLTEMKNPLIGNPVGFLIGGALFTADSFRHNFYARRIVDLTSDIECPIVCEVGGGFGGFAYHLLKRPETSFKYICYDIPIMAVLVAYYLLMAFPDKRLGLFGEVDSLADPLSEYDAVIFPHFVLPRLQDLSVDVCVNMCSFAEMDKSTVEEYMSQFERICRGFILHQNHDWTFDSIKSCYHPPNRAYKDWKLSLLEPNPVKFKRLHKIISPFQGDLYGGFYEWLYIRR